MNGEQNAAILKLAFVTLSLVFWNSHTNKTTRDASNRSGNTGSGQCCDDGTGRNEGTNSWYRQSADAHEPAKRTTQNNARSGAGRGTFWRFCVFFVGEVSRSRTFREQH